MKTTRVKNYSPTPLVLAARSAALRLAQAGGATVWVGGAVRDLLFGKPPQDIDMVSTLTPEEIRRVFPDSELIGASFGVTLVKSDGFAFEVATAREERNYLDGRHPELVKYTDDLEIDVQRRDFTINGLLYDCAAGTVIDYVGGIDDLENGLLRTIGDPDRRFGEDHLRMLRAVRFAARYQLEIVPETLAAIRRSAAKVRELSSERLRGELTSMLTGPFPARALELLSSCGILRETLPEVEALRGIEQHPDFHPEGDVWQHTMLMLRHMAAPSSDLAWSVLLHDVGKPVTVSGVGFDTHFYEHESAGAKMAEDILERFRFSNESRARIVKAVRDHMRFASVREMREAKLRRLLADPDFPLELELHRLDCLSCHGFMDCFVFLLDQLRARGEAAALPDPFVRGADLIARRWRPSPRFGEVLGDLYERQLSGELSTRDRALEFLDGISPE